MKHWPHMLVCLGLMAVAVVFIAVGAEALVFIPVLGCAAMMAMMVWMMVRH